MTRLSFGTLAMALLLPVAAHAGVMQSACLASDRPAANLAVCGCIQQVADMTLTGGDQRRAAAFFRDPDQAQKARLSKRGDDTDFWQRYTNFGDMAGVYCSG